MRVARCTVGIGLAAARDNVSTEALCPDDETLTVVASA